MTTQSQYQLVEKLCLVDFLITAKEAFFAPPVIGKIASFPSVTSWDFPRCWGNSVKPGLFDVLVHHFGAQDSCYLEHKTYAVRWKFNRKKLVGLGGSFELVINGLTLP